MYYNTTLFSDINTTLALDNSSGFRDKLLERI